MRVDGRIFAYKVASRGTTQNMYDYIFLLTCSYLIFYSGALKSQSNYAIKTARYPRTSCHQIENIPSKGFCFLSCLNKLEVHYMFSYNLEQRSCRCCPDLFGSEITDKAWETYEPRE